MLDKSTQNQLSGKSGLQGRYCRSCGSPVRQQAQFCPSCGMPLHRDTRAFPHNVHPVSSTVVGAPLTSPKSNSQISSEPFLRAGQEHKEFEPGSGAVQVCDVSQVSALRKRLGRAASGMKLIGLLSAFLILLYSLFKFGINPGVSLVLAILIFSSAFWLSHQMKAGYSFVLIPIALWTIALLAYDLLVDVPSAIGDLSSGYSIAYETIGIMVLTIPIYFVWRGIIALYAYKRFLRGNPSKSEPLIQDPWENGRKKTRKHPKFLNKASKGMYTFLLLMPLVWFVIFASSLNTQQTQVTTVAGQIVNLIGRLIIGLAVWTLMAFLYRRARRHAMLPGSKLAIKDTRAIVLYLRPFRDDRIKIRARATDGRVFLERFLKITFEELITDHLWRYGPVRAIGDPRKKDLLAPLGAAREYESDATWQQKAADLMQQASIIVAVVGETNGFIWEMERIVKLGLTSKLVLVLPPLDIKNLTIRWSNLMKVVKLPQNVNLKHLCAVVFSSDQVVLITAKDKKDWSYETALDSAAALLLK